jgi:hypothetical protein
VWARPGYPRHVDHGLWPGRVGVELATELIEQDRLARLIESTATPEVAVHAEDIASSAMPR